MFELFCETLDKKGVVKFNDRETAESYAKLLFHFGQDCWLVNNIYEYNPITDWWDNMAY